jgi:preprotein translocase subunit SecG
MLAFVIVLQVLVALFLIMVVLLQPGNRGGASAALGGAGSDTVFGARGANTFLSKITFGAAVCFMVTNLALSFMSSSIPDKSVLDDLAKTAPKASPAGAPADDVKEKAQDLQQEAPAEPAEDLKNSDEPSEQQAKPENSK